MPQPSRPPVLAQRTFAEQREVLTELELADRFARIYESGLWGGTESRSGTGSSLESTAALRARLPVLLRELGVQRLLDVPCGDFHWMRHVDLGPIDYIGGDIVEELVLRNRRAYEREAGEGTGSRRFIRVDLTAGLIPEADAVFCRDGLVHFSFVNIERAFATIREGGARYLIATTFTAHDANDDIEDGDWRPLNLERPPFTLPPPIALIDEQCPEEGGAYADKSLGVWRVDDLRDARDATDAEVGAA